MSKIEDLIKQYCPNGVEWKHLYEVTVWDKRFNSVERYKQPTVIDYKKYFLGEEQKQLVSDGGSVKILTTYASNLYADENSVADYITDGEIVCIPWGGNAIVQYYKGKFVTGDNRIATSLDVNVLSNKYLYYMMQCNLHLIASFYRGSGIKHPDMSKVLDILIPVPPRPVQDEIVRILDKFTELEKELEKELELRRKQYEWYRDELLTFGDDVERKRLGDVCSKITDGSHSSPRAVENGYYMPSVKDMTDNGFVLDKCKQISLEDYNALVRNGCKPEINDVVIAKDGSMLRYIFEITKNENIVLLSSIAILRPLVDVINPRYLVHCLRRKTFRNVVIEKYSTKGGVPRIILKNFKQLEIPVPSLTEQERIVKILDKFDTLTTNLTSGLPAEIKLRKQQYEYYRDYLFGLLN